MLLFQNINIYIYKYIYKLFYKIISELNKYENIIIGLKTSIEKFQKILIKYYVDILYMIINGVIISKYKNKNIIEIRLKNIKGSGLSNVKIASALSNVKKSSGLKSVKGGA